MSNPQTDPAWRQPVALIRDPDLAAILGAMDFPEDPRGGFLSMSGDLEGERYSFCTRSRCGKYGLEEIRAAWEEGPAFCERNPDHPVSFIIAAFRWRVGIEALRRRRPAHYAQAGRSAALIFPDSPREVQETLCRKIGI